jgi:exosortase
MPTTKNATFDAVMPQRAAVESSRILGFLLVVLLPLIVVGTTMWPMVAATITDETTSHIPLIPLVSVFLVYTERHRIFSQASTTGWRSGRIFASLGLAGLTLAEFNPWHASAQTSFSIAVLGTVLIWVGAFALFFGEHALRAASFSLEFLVFMIPIPQLILDRIIYFLQEGSSDVVAVIFRLSGVPFLRQGFDFALPGVTIRVAQECSGIRSTLALVIVAVLMAHLFLRTFWKQALLCALVVPLAVFKNGLRIFTLSTLAIYVNPSFLSGNLHRRGGIVFFLVALIPLALTLSLLRKNERAPQQGPPL